MFRAIIMVMFASHQMILSQDSMSAAFLTLLNKYRIEMNLPTVEYDMQLDSLALVRLIESAKGINDCFEEEGFYGHCKDGMRNLHFKFMRNTEDFHNNSNRIFVFAENMIVAPEYFTYQKGLSLGGTPISISETIYVKNGRNIANPDKEFLDAWIKSPGHNVNLLARDGTLCAFKTYRTMHSNKQWLHGVFLIAKKR
jgi:uncharacterized protein YkwD